MVEILNQGGSHESYRATDDQPLEVGCRMSQTSPAPSYVPSINDVSLELRAGSDGEQNLAHLSTSSTQARKIPIRTSTNVSLDSQKTPTSSAFQIAEVLQRHSTLVERRLLLNQQASFLSSSESSAASSRAPSIITREDIILSLAASARRNTTASIQAFHPGDGDCVQATEASRADLQALATEQGEIPVSALTSPTYSNRSTANNGAAGIIVPLSIAGEDDDAYHRLRLPQSVETSHPMPLAAHPVGNLPRRSATLPAKISRKPVLLPRLEPPKSQGSMLREDNMSTSCPGSDFCPKDERTHSMNPGLSKAPLKKRELSTRSIPVIIHDSQNVPSGVGRIELSSPSNRISNSSRREDDYSLAQNIKAEHYRLRGKLRVFLSARSLVGVRIIWKARSRETYTTHPHKTDAIPHDRHTRDSDSSQTEPTSSPNAASCPRLEESLSLLLQRPSLGRDSQLVSTELYALVAASQSKLTAGQPSQLQSQLQSQRNHANNQHSIPTLSLLESWNWKRLAYAIGSVILLSLLSMILWIVLGEDGCSFDFTARASASTGHRGFPSNQSSQSSQSRELAMLSGSAGTRVTAGAVLGVLTLLLGWTVIGLWAGMSWLIR